MKILIVCSGNNGSISPFIIDQVNAINKQGVDTDYFYVKGKGIKGYLKASFLLRKKIKTYKPDIIHAHYGLSGLLSTLQRKVPVIITFHGCDINLPKNRILSNIASKISYRSIYVSKELADLSKQNNTIVIPCGVDLDIFYPVEKLVAKVQMNLNESKKYILFSSSFNNEVKNYQLAKEAIDILNEENIELLELKGYDRNQVALLMNAVDLVLLTSHREGSPQFIKEALACNTPIVSVDVGDVKELINGVEGAFLSTNNAKTISENISKALSMNEITSSQKNMDEFDNRLIANKIIDIYNDCLA